jgi:hypothetical protein
MSNAALLVRGFSSLFRSPFCELMIVTKQVRAAHGQMPILLDVQISLLTHSLGPNTKITGIEENDPYVYSRLHIVQYGTYTVNA